MRRTSFKSGISKLYGEYWFFLRWIVLKFKLFTVAFWIVRKLINRAWLRGNRLNAYPPEVRALVLKTSICLDFSNIHKVNTLEKIECTKFEGPESIQLASCEMGIVAGKIDWPSTFSDSEDEESLHRWNFLMHLLGKKIKKQEHLFWAGEQVNVWVDMFQQEIKSLEKNQIRVPRWESYTISERLANFSIFCKISCIKPSLNIVEALVEQGNYLTRNLEYHGNYTGNHVVNNGRCLYLFGSNFGISRFSELGRDLIMRELPDLVSLEGFVREGSTHYQFLITRWLLEVRFFVQSSNDFDFLKMLDKYCEKLESKCQFFQTSDIKDCSMEYPLFGDISPDCSPEWLLHLSFSRLSRESNSENYTSCLPELSWNWIWE